jgi:Cupin domain
MVPEAPLERTEDGIAPAGEGWFVLNARDAPWFQGEGVSASCEFEGKTEFPQIGFFIRVLGPGEPMAMYHWEADQEDFLVLSGEALLVVEGEERPLRQWDFFHCPAGRITSSSAPETGRARSWPSVPVRTRALRAGALLRSPTERSNTARASMRRQPIRREPTPGFPSAN